MFMRRIFDDVFTRRIFANVHKNDDDADDDDDDEDDDDDDDDDDDEEGTADSLAFTLTL